MSEKELINVDALLKEAFDVCSDEAKRKAALRERIARYLAEQGKPVMGGGGAPVEATVGCTSSESFAVKPGIPIATKEQFFEAEAAMKAMTPFKLFGAKYVIRGITFDHHTNRGTVDVFPLTPICAVEPDTSVRDAAHANP
jgi:hypothetical protein